ncbi:TolC family outer membrane protein [Caulobacter sp. S45]|uniref:TolC family outer membrane protein n=1 Tax=Caulobacter sp. S45 TaxID=1641861 RepID=UPI00131EC29D|nr:TolC family outer membrane protein [Caulobacter sp. S45]
MRLGFTHLPRGALVFAALMLGGGPSPGWAETLADALALAYQSNPTLQAQRAQLRALDETYTQARSGFGPQASANLAASYTKEPTSSFTGTFFPDVQQGQASVTVSQSVYSGGRLSANLRAARAGIDSGRESLRYAEANTLYAVIQAYVDTVRDFDSLKVRRGAFAVFQHQLDETDARFKGGDATRTDVAQARAQLEAERALVNSAAAQLEASRAEYADVVGQNPGTLIQPAPLPGLPKAVDQAFDLAEQGNPQLLQAIYAEEKSREQIRAARAAYRPSVSVQGTLGLVGGIHPFLGNSYERVISGQLVLTQPLFTSGMNGSLIRQALEQNNSDRVSIEASRRSVVQAVSNAWNGMLTSTANIDAEKAQVDAAQIEASGMQEEYLAGLRSTLDALVAEETLRDAQLSLIAARHDAYLNAAGVLLATGGLQANKLLTNVPLYNASANFDVVKNRGALPWEPVLRALDSTGQPGAGQRPISAPPASVLAPLMAHASSESPIDALATQSRTTPIAGTDANDGATVRLPK